MSLILISNAATRISKIWGGKPFAQLLKNFNRIIYACDIGLGCYIPKSCKFHHSGLGCVFHVNAKIGENCNVYPNVVIGASGRPDEGNLAPVIGDNVTLCVGAKVLGNISVGNGSIVAANAVVLDNVPENVVVAGVPAKIVKRI